MQFQNTLENSIALKISIKMQQSLQVLQMSTIEFVDYLNEKAIENIVLEVEQPEILFDFQDYRKYNKSALLQSEKNIENIHVSKTNDYQVIKRLVFEQLPYKRLECKQCVAFIDYLVRNMTTDGYLEIELDEAAIQFDISYKQALFLLKEIQMLEPIGICARSVKECILLQIEHHLGVSSLAYRIVNECNYYLERKDLKAVSKRLGCSVSEVKSALEYIKTLKLRPLASYIPSHTEYVIPDIIISINDNKLDVQINKHFMPKVTINNPFEQIHSDLDKTTKRYVNQHVAQAEELLSTIKKREETLLKLALAIVSRQSAFLQYGICSLKPMKLQDIATDIGVHQSTISRAVRNKYIQTPVGTFELGTLFMNGIETSDGNLFSVQTIKESIRSLILNEDKRKPLSDQKIGEILKQRGIAISRRTVAKYREAIGIVSSVNRLSS